MNGRAIAVGKARLLLALVGRALHHYEERGLRNVAYRTAVFLRRFLTNGFCVPKYQSGRRVDVDDRWKLIRAYLSPGDNSLLDIGCADGLLTSRFASEGLFCMGIDRNERHLALARSRDGSGGGIGFVQYEATPATVPKLPRHDVVLLLTVYHWWCKDFGVDRAEDMLRALARKTRKLFFEPPPVPINQLVLDGVEVSGAAVDRASGEPIEEYYRAYLEHVLDDDTDIEYIGTSEYAETERRDPLFVIRADGIAP